MSNYKTTPAVSLKFTATEFPRQKIGSSTDASEFIRQFYSDDLNIYESFFLLLLSRANETIGYAKISQGGCVGTVVDVKIICKYAIEALAQSVVIAHNHPSGNKQPSNEDKKITAKVVEALKMFDIATMDHIILTADSYYSFADDGII